MNCSVRWGLIALLGVLAGSSAWAHGPTVRVTASRVQPEKIALYAGQTLHFVNASPTATTLTLRADDGSFESPPLSRGGDWHHTFETPGVFTWSAVERSALRGEILVAPPRAED